MLKISSCFSSATPASIERTPAAVSTGSDSHTMRRSTVPRARHVCARETTVATTSRSVRLGVTYCRPTSCAANHSAGIVSTSPRVETIGATRLSRSQPKRTAPTVRTSVATSTTSEASAPPRTATRTRSPREAGMRPSATASALAPIARSSDDGERQDHGGGHVLAEDRVGRAEKRKVPSVDRVLEAGCRAQRTRCPAGRWRRAPAPAGPAAGRACR